MDQDVNGMAHEDIWDDSALVNSWNEALAEYKKYHSLQATGGTLDDLLPEHAKPETSRGHGDDAEPRGEGVAAVAIEQHDSHQKAAADRKAQTTDGAAKASNLGANDRIDHAGLAADGDVRAKPQGMTGANSAASALSPPHALLGSVQDEGLKRLLMAWYYAGYYTGLHQGQQRDQNERQ